MPGNTEDNGDPIETSMVRGVSWSAAGQMGSEAMRILTGIVLARLLGPAQFGLVGMVLVLANFANVLLNFGFGAAIVHRKDPTEEDLSTVFWFNLFMGAVLNLGLAVGAPAVAWFFDEPALRPIAVAMSFNFSLLSLGLIQRTLLQKELRFRAIAAVELCANLISAIVALGAALTGFGVWSLVAWLLVRSGVTTAGTWLLGGWRPRMRFSVASFKSMSSFALNVVGSETLGYLSQNLDKLLVGRFLGAVPLGLYEQASRLVLIPMTNISLVIARVMFPSFARIQDQPDRVRDLFLKVCRIAMFLSAPMLVGLAAAARPFVSTVYGAEWAGLIPLLHLFAGLGLVGTIMALQRSIFFSLGRADTEFRVGLVRRAVTIGGAAAGLPWGVLGVAAGKLLGSLVGFWVTLTALGRLLDVSTLRQTLNLVPSLGCAICMGALVFLFDLALFSSSDQHALALVLEILLGACAYIAAAAIVGVDAWRELRAIIGARVRRST